MRVRPRRPELTGGTVPSLPFAWPPTPLTPVRWGADAFTIGDGAPTQLRVWYPSRRTGGPIITDEGRFPLIVLLHGQCQLETEPHLHWEETARSLARSGYMVAAPNLGGLVDFNDPADLAAVGATVRWMLDRWAHRALVHPQEIGIAGHSYGGLLAIRYATGAPLPPVSAVAVLSSSTHDAPSVLAPLRNLAGARLFCFGGQDSPAEVGDAEWAEAAGAGHEVRFTDAGHWDCFPEPTPCAEGLFDERGPCAVTWKLSRDVVTVFFGKYLHPHRSSHAPLPDSLIPPRLSFFFRFFSGGHLAGFRQRGGNSTCGGTSRWRTTFVTGDIGSRTF